MSYRIEWEQDAVDLRISWLSTNQDNIKPQALAGKLRGYFKIRVGDYRVIYSIVRENRLLVIH